MTDIDYLKQDILLKIREISENNGGKPPGRDKFHAVTGIKPHQWYGKIWRNWGDAIAEAGYSPNGLRIAVHDDELLDVVCHVSKSLGRFPSTGDLLYEAQRINGAARPKTILARWKMMEMAEALAIYAAARGEHAVEEFARNYMASNAAVTADTERPSSAVGFVYLQRHGSDYKIGFTSSLNKRGRQVQIELPQETELVHSILTDDPRGIEAYWHKRFADKRTRGEWFKLTKADVAAFRRWSKIW